MYLPASWLRESADPRAVPVEDRAPATKTEIALRLIDEVRTEGEWTGAVIGEAEYLVGADFREALTARGLTAQDGQEARVAEALRRFEWMKNPLGLDHFEGRAWHGWHHHVGLVFTAYGFLCDEAATPDAPPFPSPVHPPV
ncbi:hypothetical protein [Frigoriglobus tundricola]|uniref:Mobile element protein n=1 Tax=Frigoriglobus tundricola TaxID=2774151 RepID=A0A6M5Z3X0_9BACT|nr:Mobile element protein [Frigoriglobus tundricola]